MSDSSHQSAIQIRDFIHQHPRLFVLTGAGISTESGIPAYRDADGKWQHKQPVQHQHFMTDQQIRQRYWARSLVGWPVIRDAEPGIAHRVLAQLEHKGHIEQIVTQNVDRLHQQAGSRRVIDLHGRSDRVRCMSCQSLMPRDLIHHQSASNNPDFSQLSAAAAPDGDAHLETCFESFQLPDCPHCQGILKPDVVFFGDNVPKSRVLTALDHLQRADAMLVIGSSLMVYSGYRFCRRAEEWQKPICSLTLGKTRADQLLSLKLNAPIGETLQQLQQLYKL